MQHQRRKGGSVRGGRSREKCSSRDDATRKTRAAGRDPALQQEAPHPEWNASDWKRWDESHGNMLWMGALQEDWNNATIVGFFRHHGAKISVTRKGQDKYCFVAFASAEDANNFMARYNHKPLPGKPGSRFTIRPRTRPRWFREAEHRSSKTADGGDRGESDHGNCHGKSSSNGNSHDHRVERGTGGRDARKRQQCRGVKTEKVYHQSHHAHQARRAGMAKPEDCGYYGRGGGGSGLGRGGPDRGGREDQPPGMTPSSRQRAVPDHDGNTRAFRQKNGKRLRGRTRSHSRSRSPPSSRLRSRSGTSSSGTGSRDGSRRSSRSQDSVQPRRQYDPSFQQARLTSDGVFGGGRGYHGSHWLPSNASNSHRDSLRGDGSFSGAKGGTLSPDSDGSGVAVDTCSSDVYNGAKRRITTVNSTITVAIRGQGCASGRSDIKPQEVAGRGPCGGGAKGAGRDDENAAVQYLGNNGHVNSHDHTIPDSASGYHDRSSPPKQGTASRVEDGVHGGEEHESAEPTTTLNGGEGATGRSQQTESGVKFHETDREETFEEHLVREDSSSSPRTAGGEGCRDFGTTRCGLDSVELSPGRFIQPQSPTQSHETSCSPMIGLEGGIEAGTGNTSRIQDDPLDKARHTDGGLIPADDRLNQQFAEGIAEDAVLAATIHTSEAVESTDRQIDNAYLASALCDGSSGCAASGRDTCHEMHDPRSTREQGGVVFEGMGGKGGLHREGKRQIRTSPLPPPTALPSCQVGTGTCVAQPPGGSLIVSDAAAGLHQPENNMKENSADGSVCDATLSRNDGSSGRRPRPNGGSGDDRPVKNKRLHGSCTSRTPPVLESRTTQEADHHGFESGSRQNPPTPTPRRGTKRRNTADITLAQVIEHHMARRRLKGVVSSSQGSRVGSNSSRRSATAGQHVSSASNIRGTRQRSQVEWPSSADAAGTADTQSPASDGSAIVAAAWANGCVLPLTAVAAPHMRLVAPLLAAEPEGRRVVVRTAAAVAAAASILALPEHRLEVTGVCRDGLLLELHPKNEGKHGSGFLNQGKGSEIVGLLSTLAGQLQAAIDGLVALDLEFEMVQLPQGEAVDTMATSPSSVELLKWLNEGTANLLRLAPAPPSTGTSSVDEVPRGRDSPTLVDLRKAFAYQGGGVFLGIDCGLWPLLPRTGLLESFDVIARPVALPPLEIPIGGNRANRSRAVHLAVTLSNTGVYHGNSGSLRALHGGGYQSTRSNGDVTAADLSQLDASPLGCVPPTCTADGLTWREVTGLKCVAAVNRLALGSQKELDGKLQLSEGLLTAQIEALAKKIAVSGALLVVLAGRQGASADVVASRLCVELSLKGKNPAPLDTTEYLRPGAPQPSIPVEMGHRQPISDSPAPSSSQRLDSAALGEAVAALLGQARAGVGLSVVSNGGSRAAAGGAGVAGPEALAEAWPWCDVVVVYGCEALEVGLLPPGGFGLGPAEALSVFVDLVPQVCVDNLTPIDGADVRALRALLTARGSFAAAAEVAAFAVKGGDGLRRPSFFDTNGFLNEWFATEEREESLCRSFRAAAKVHVNTALPYDLNALKALAEPLLRSVPPPKNGHSDGGGGGDGCRSSTYALARSVLRLLRLCEVLPARGTGRRYPYCPS